jgi:hypothetical protein
MKYLKGVKSFTTLNNETMLSYVLRTTDWVLGWMWGRCSKQQGLQWKGSWFEVGM